MAFNRILIADNEPDSVHILRFALERAGYAVQSTASAPEAATLAFSQQFDLLVLDVVLGEGSAVEVCKALRSAPTTQHLPILLVTGKLRTESDTVAGLKAGADDYIMKPFRPADVVERVAALLDRDRQQHDLSALTGLPGPLAIASRLQNLVSCATPWGVLFVDLEGFRPYNELFGYKNGDDVLRSLADCVLRAAATDTASFVGHSGGDQFFVATTPAAMELIAASTIDRFASEARTVCSPQAFSRNLPSARTGPDAASRQPLLSLSIGGVSNELRSFGNPLEVAAVAAELKRALRGREGSNYLKDRRAARLS